MIAAPALLEQPDATCFIEPGLRGRVDAWGNVVVERSDDDSARVYGPSPGMIPGGSA